MVHTQAWYRLDSCKTCYLDHIRPARPVSWLCVLGSEYLPLAIVVVEDLGKHHLFVGGFNSLT